MATYYISSSGSDANNGLGPDASAVTNKPWLTLGKALNTGSTVVPGDTVYIGPGILYEGAGIAPIAGVTSTASPTAIRGDPTNAQGFKTAGGVLFTPSVCWVSTRTSGDGIDGTITSTAGLFTPAVTCHGLQFYDLCLEARGSSTSGAIFTLNGNGNADWLVQDCRLIGFNLLVYVATGALTAARNTTFRRCTVLTTSGMLNLNITVAAATADADAAVLFESCLILTRAGVGIALAASGGNLGGGFRFKGNTFTGSNGTAATLSTTAVRVSTVNPIRVEGNLFIGGGLQAGTTGQVVDDGYNRLWNGVAPINVTLAGTSITDPLLNLVLPDLVKWGLEMPRADSFGWTDAAATAQKYSAWSNTAADFRGRTVRPWGSGASIGAHDFGLIGQDTGSQITGGGANSLKITGAGEVSIYVPVDASLTALTVITESLSYGGSSWPQLIVMPNPSCGVTLQTITATSAAEQTLMTASFTPTAAGVIELRLVSRSTSVSSSTYFDSLAG